MMRKLAKESTTCDARRPVCKVEHSQDAVRVKRLGAQSNKFLHKQLENQNCFWKALSTEHAKGVWVRNWMGLEVHATLFHTYPPSRIGKNLKALREEVKENNQRTTVQEI